MSVYDKDHMSVYNKDHMSELWIKYTVDNSEDLFHFYIHIFLHFL